MSKVFVVTGSTGEYSDRSEWNVVAVNSREVAERYVLVLQRQYQSIPPDMKENRWDHEDDIKAIMSLDPHFEQDYTGSRWYVSEVTLLADAELPAELAVI